MSGKIVSLGGVRGNKRSSARVWDKSSVVVVVVPWFNFDWASSKTYFAIRALYYLGSVFNLPGLRINYW